MALTKSRSAITQVTATGTSTALDVSSSYGQSLYIRHSNGTGTPTVAAILAVQVKPSGGTYITMITLTASLTATQLDTWVVPIPDDAVGVQIVYTQPTGPSSYTLDAEVGTITAL